MNKKYSKNNVNSSFFGIHNDKYFQILKLAIGELKEKYGLNSNEILGLIEEKPVSKEILIPVSIFEISKLSALEAICKYLKEELDLTYSKIATILNRDSRTIWTTYNNAIKNIKEKLYTKESKFFIPVSILANRKLSVLEAIVSYLKDNLNLRYIEIASLINRNERNVWAAYNKAKKKQK